MLLFSTISHNNDSMYYNTSFLTDQYVGFEQLTWFKSIGKHDFLTGLTYRYTYYDDNTPATADASNLEINQASSTHLPGLFVQDEITFDDQNKILLGVRYDYNSLHGSRS